MTDISNEVMQAAARKSLVVFSAFVLSRIVPDYRHFPYIDFVAANLEAAMRDPQNRRLVLNLPPRHLKSLLFIVTAAWFLGKNPKREVLFIAHSMALARDLAAKVSQLLASPFFREIFPGFELLTGRESTTDFRTMAGGGFLASGVDGGITGRGADLILIDDTLSANNAESAVMRETVIANFDGMIVTRLNDPASGAIVAMSHRLHRKDLTAHLIDAGFRQVRLAYRAVEDERYVIGDEVFERKKGELLQPGRALDNPNVPEPVFLTQYQQMPAADGVGVFHERHFQYTKTCPPGGRLVASWDLASSLSESASYSVCLVFSVHKSAAYLCSIFRARVDYGELKTYALNLQNKEGIADHLIESASLGASLASDLRAAGAKVEELPVRGASKVARVERVYHRLETRYVQFLRDTPGLREFVDELLAFPHGQHDDQVDAFSQFLNWLDGERPGHEAKKTFRSLGTGQNTKRAFMDRFVSAQGIPSPYRRQHRR